ncbi:hypothetical protein [Hymenobacter latericus]|uniref:hypothetical protein n=1 Tax=Hymenobacter sp. YIM 151858-1 TaxID=2987688 RepID=UPI002225F116|nr:hypothetical protein [Hymenobacter sp. YIM 151858-1]UYZ61177.1 hypothetical protein OIS50_19600 [Hymenobacter sp. YIM 151858-1]
MKHAKLLTQACLTAATLLAFGCSKEADVKPRNEAMGLRPSTSLQETQNYYLDDLARVMATVLAKNDAARGALLEEVSKQFDGDYDARFTSLLAVNVGGASFENLLNEAGLKTNPAEVGLSVEQFNRIVVSIPVLQESWSKVHAPIVTYIPEGVLDLDLNSTRAYNAAGEAFELPTREEPTLPAVVASFGERLDEKGEVRPEFIAPVLETGERGGGNYEYLSRMKCTNLGAIEPWLRGKPELRLYAAIAEQHYSNGGQTTTQVANIVEDGTLFQPSRNDISNGISLWYRMFRWENTTTSSASREYKIRWREEDGGPTLKVKTKLAFTWKNKMMSTEVTVFEADADFSAWEKDDEIGTKTVHVNDPNTFDYNYGSIFQTTLVSSAL